MKPELSKEVVWNAFACSQCGYCRYVCPLYDVLGWESLTPRGQLFFLKEYLNGNIEFSERMADVFEACTTCGRCTVICQNNIPIHELWEEMKGTITEKMKFVPPLPFLLIKKNIWEKGNPFGEPREGRIGWIPQEISFKDKAELGYFAGCGPIYQSPNISENVVRIFNKAGIEFAYLATDEWCCGMPILMSGQIETAKKVIQHNIEEINKRGIKTITTGCGSCWYILAKRYPKWAQELGLGWNIEVKNVVEILNDLVMKGSINFEKSIDARVTYHDPCHIGRAGEIYEQPREVLKSIPGLELVEMEHNRKNAPCCGTVPLRLRHPEWADKIGGLRISEAEKCGAEILCSACTPCEWQFRICVDNVGSHLRITDITDLVAEAMGMEVHDKEATQIFLSRWKMMKGMIAMMAELSAEKREELAKKMDIEASIKS